MKRDADRLPLIAKAQLVARIWWSFLKVGRHVKRTPLPLMMELLEPRSQKRPWVEPRRLGRVIARVLHFGRFRPRCLILALVHYRLLREQHAEAELVIGLPASPRGKEAHAWIEIDGTDVGPPPGRGRHEELARYGPADTSVP